MEVEITGDWTTTGKGAGAREVIAPVELSTKSTLLREEVSRKGAKTQSAAAFHWTFFAPLRLCGRISCVADVFIAAKFAPAGNTGDIENPEAAQPAAPIRVTSPGLTVYKGGAITPRLYLIRQHLGPLKVDRQMIDVSLSYTPSQRLQLEAEVPVSRTSFHDELSSGSNVGLGNITVWSKYRFFREVKTYGDRQAAVRFGLELPTGKKDAPTQTQINVPAFVRQQLTPINGGLAPHFDLAFSQAGGRFIFGGNAEVIFRAERDGFRMGHEQRVNTDLEYMLLPRDYQKPGGELFLILETTFVHRGTGRINGARVDGSKTTEYYLAPGLQYAARPRFVVEGSVQFPVLRNTGPLALRTDVNVLLGVKYLF